MGHRALLRAISRHVTTPTQAETLKDKMDDLRQRRAAYARAAGVETDAYEAFKGDRWFPDWMSPSRAWLGKS